MSEPTPVADWLLRVGETKLFLGLGLAFIAVALVAEPAGLPIWVGAGAVVAGPIFTGAGLLKIGWKRYKQWRYPTYYDSPEADQ